jgi:hypothetical protein
MRWNVYLDDRPLRRQAMPYSRNVSRLAVLDGLAQRSAVDARRGERAGAQCLIPAMPYTVAASICSGDCIFRDRQRGWDACVAYSPWAAGASLRRNEMRRGGRGDARLSVRACVQRTPCRSRSALARSDPRHGIVRQAWAWLRSAGSRNAALASQLSASDAIRAAAGCRDRPVCVRLPAARRGGQNPRRIAAQCRSRESAGASPRFAYSAPALSVARRDVEES